MTAVSSIAPASPGGLAPPPARAGPLEPGFGQILEELAASTIGTLKAGETAAIAGLEGKLPVQDVVTAVMSAERSFQTAIAIRDKVVGAWLEMSRMQI